MVSPQLLDYVRTQLAAGVTKDALLKAIVAQGWTAQDAQDAFVQVATVSAPKSHTGIIAAGIVLLLCAIAGGGYFYYYNYYAANATPAAQSPALLPTGPGGSSATDQTILPTSGAVTGDTYTLEDMSLTYPASWVVKFPDTFSILRATFHPAGNASSTMQTSLTISTSTEPENIVSFIAYHKKVLPKWTLTTHTQMSIPVEGSATGTVQGDIVTATFTSPYGTYNDEEKSLTFIYKGNQYTVSLYGGQINWSALLPQIDAAFASVKLKS